MLEALQQIKTAKDVEIFLAECAFAGVLSRELLQAGTAVLQGLRNLERSKRLRHVVDLRTQRHFDTDCKRLAGAAASI